MFQKLVHVSTNLFSKVCRYSNYLHTCTSTLYVSLILVKIEVLSRLPMTEEMTVSSEIGTVLVPDLIDQAETLLDLPNFRVKLAHDIF